MKRNNRYKNGIEMDDFKALSDIEDVKNDRGYLAANGIAEGMIAGYGKDPVRKLENEKFILAGISELMPEEDLKNEISRIKNEICQSNLNDISSEWVKEWNEKGKKNNSDTKTKEVRDFITRFTEPEGKCGVHRVWSVERGVWSVERRAQGIEHKAPGSEVLRKTRLYKYTSLAAAAIIGFVFLMRSLLPSGDPQKVFAKYYEPFDAVSVLNRGTGSGENDILDRAIGFYKSGNYEAAGLGFSKAMLNQSTSSTAIFYQGIIGIETGNYDRAIELLNEVVKRQGEYAKEASWYLGLAYMKTGDKAKASRYLEVLAQSPGFYSDRAEKILRRLK